ncbi:MAG: PLP-dependent transferase, partial [Gaiellales bacterium]
AGRQAGCIRPYVNDYKRDRHLDAGRYESAFLREYVDAPPGEPVRALLTSCGMAGLTTILGYLRLEGHLVRPVVAGRALYHETALLLTRELGDRLVVVDERDSAEVIETVRRTGAGALFVDSLCNSRGLALPDTARIIRGLAGDDVHVVIDNTGLSIGFQPWALRSGRTRLLVWESLLKYAQLGLDRTTAGVVVCSGPGTERLDIYREHLGTNIADISVLALPPPHRSILSRRLARLERNARLIADALGQWAVYPGRGGCLELAVRDRAGFAERALAAARAAGVPLVAGTSFGFHITRIYAAAEGSACGPPFLRVSAGSEHRLGAEAVASALARTLEVLA